MDSSDYLDSSLDEVPEAKRMKMNATNELDLDSMKVKELRDALEERGLESKGVKAVLKERLLEALSKEKADAQEAAMAAAVAMAAAEAAAAKVVEAKEASSPEEAAPRASTPEHDAAEAVDEPLEPAAPTAEVNGVNEDSMSNGGDGMETDDKPSPAAELKSPVAAPEEKSESLVAGEEEMTSTAEEEEEEEEEKKKMEETIEERKEEEEEEKEEQKEEEEEEKEEEPKPKAKEEVDEEEEPTVKPKAKEEEDEEPNPELMKYWKGVKDDPTDFTAWTYLLQYVEQNDSVRPFRQAFDAFLKRYPYCYGYWKKYADMERKHENPIVAEKVFERGVEAIPLSIDLWIHYLNFYVDQFGKNVEDYDKIRKLYERAVISAGLEFRSDKLWDHYINWETSKKHMASVFNIYKRLIAIPTQLYSGNFEKFKTFVQSNDPKDILTESDYADLAKRINDRKRRKQKKEEEEKEKDKDKDNKEKEDKEAEEKSEESNDPTVIASEDKAKARDKIISQYESLYKNTELEVSKRWAFEEGIKRPYFHVKPLEKAQLKNWKEYLDFEVDNGGFERSVVLFERCVIACALYEEYWQKYIGYLKKHSDEAARSVYQRACGIHLQRKPTIHMEWAAFEESQGNTAQAASILNNIQNAFPDLLLISTRLIGLHRRKGDKVKVVETFEQCLLDSAKSTDAFNFFSVKFARFLSKENNYERAREVLRDAIKKDKENVRLQMQLLDVELRNEVVNESRVLKIFEQLVKNEKDDNRKLQFSHRRLEYLEEQGGKIETLLHMHEEHQNLVANLAKKRGSDDRDDSKKHRERSSSSSASAPVAAAAAAAAASNGATPAAAAAPPTTSASQWDATAAAAAAWGQSQGQWGQWGQGQWGQGYGGYGYGSYGNYGGYQQQ